MGLTLAEAFSWGLSYCSDCGLCIWYLMLTGLTRLELLTGQ